MKIRIATNADIAELTELKRPQNPSHREKYQSRHFERLKDVENGNSIYLVVEEDNKIIAHLLLKLKGIPTEPDYPNMNDLYVSEEQRNKGVGSALIREAEKIIKEKGFSRISIAVNPTLNPKAKALYERLGYHQTRTEPYLDGVYDGDEDWVIDMVKDLS